jgi:hypothetical protein
MHARPLLEIRRVRVSKPLMAHSLRCCEQAVGIVVEGEGAEAGVSGHYALLMGHGSTRKRKHKPLTVSPVVEEVELPSAQQLKNLRLPESAQPWEVLQVRHANPKTLSLARPLDRVALSSRALYRRPLCQKSRRAPGRVRRWSATRANGLTGMGGSSVGYGMGVVMGAGGV